MRLDASGHFITLSISQVDVGGPSTGREYYIEIILHYKKKTLMVQNQEAGNEPLERKCTVSRSTDTMAGNTDTNFD